MFENRVEYKGEFKNNLYNGEREYKWSIGRSYKVNFKDGLMNGKGIHRWKTRIIYIGNYLNRKKYGKGLYTSSSGKKLWKLD